MEQKYRQITIDDSFITTASFKLVDDILFSNVGDEGVLLHLKLSEYYSLNETCLPFWEALQNHQPFEPVIEKMISEYDVERTQVICDLKAFLTDLSKLGLLLEISN